MFCPTCKRCLQDDDRFCSGCGRPIESDEFTMQITQEENGNCFESGERALERLDKAYAYFRKKRDLYFLHGNLLEKRFRINRPSGINYFLGGIFLSLTCCMLICFLFGIDLAIWGYILIFYIPFGIILPTNHYRKKLKESLEKEKSLDQQIKEANQELYEYYEAYSDKIISYEYSNPYRINKLINIIKNGRADTVKEAINCTLDDTYKEEMASLQREIVRNTREAAVASKVAAVISGANYIEKHLEE